ncbi:hypothetical protein CL628_03490 [bacterium]|nr:hypothetical protein [bacterium]
MTNEEGAPKQPDADKMKQETLVADARRRSREHKEVERDFGEPAAESIVMTVGAIADVERAKVRQLRDGPGSTGQKREAVARYVGTWSEFAREVTTASTMSHEQTRHEEVERFVGGVTAALGRKDPQLTKKYRDDAEALFKTLKGTYSFDC